MFKFDHKIGLIRLIKTKSEQDKWVDVLTYFKSLVVSTRELGVLTHFSSFRSLKSTLKLGQYKYYKLSKKKMS